MLDVCNCQLGTTKIAGRGTVNKVATMFELTMFARRLKLFEKRFSFHVNCDVCKSLKLDKLIRESRRPGPIRDAILTR